VCASASVNQPTWICPNVWFLRLRGGRWRKRRRGLGAAGATVFFGGGEVAAGVRQCRRLLDRPGRDSWPLPLNKIRLFGSLLGQREAHRHDPILLLDEAAQRLKAGDFGGHDERFGGNLQRKGLLAPEQAMLRDSFRRSTSISRWLRKPTWRRVARKSSKTPWSRLREHGLGVLAVAFFHLAPALKSHHYGSRTCGFRKAV